MRNKQIGFVMQDYALLERLSVFENIATPMYIAHSPQKRIEEKVYSLVEKFHIEKLLDKSIYQLSGGEKQRVAIARAIVQEPKLLLADEPTGSLDEENKKDVFKMLKHIYKKGTSIVIVTHDREIAYQCDKKYYLQNGKIEIEKN
ncbi:macrolide export ATP-binding/permease protein MacB [Clostridium sp. CAG:411]|nr:macrolide export ATP-binding/permease protein MacB [Clostridium sp. CAG:411]